MRPGSRVRKLLFFKYFRGIKANKIIIYDYQSSKLAQTPYKLNQQGEEFYVTESEVVAVSRESVHWRLYCLHRRLVNSNVVYFYRWVRPAIRECRLTVAVYRQSAVGST